MIEQRHASLQAYRHRGAIDLRQDVVGEIGQRVESHHSLDRGANSRIEPRRFVAVAALFRRASERPAPPFRRERMIHIIGAAHVAERRRELVGLVLERRSFPPRPGRRNAASQAVEGSRPITAPTAARNGAGIGASRPPAGWSEHIAIVAAEQLVPRVAGKRHGDGSPRDRANDARRNLRAVGEGLVIAFRQLRHHRAGLLRRDPNLVMVGLEMTRDLPRMRGFVEAGFVEADRESLGRPRRPRLHESDDCR